MNIVEIRDLDGPNLFLPGPAIKVEVAADGEPLSLRGEPITPDALFAAIEAAVLDLHAAVDQPTPDLARKTMEAERHFSVAFTWTHRRFADCLGRRAAELAFGARDDRDAVVAELQGILASAPDDDDAPEMIETETRRIPIIAITGTNGKTTTSRVIASVLRGLGNKVGLTSSAGVYIDTTQVLSGDYSGPAGAHRVFEEPDVDYAVLETARGGMLLRGLGFESADVSIVTNVSPDHLGLHGIYTVEGLAEVKSLVPRYTRGDGFAILNADDSRVLTMREQTDARAFLVTRKPMTLIVQQHIDAGGWVLAAQNGNITWFHDHIDEELADLTAIPMTFGGRADHNVENVMCAAAGLLALGIDASNVRAGLEAFRSTAENNRGRLNVYQLNGGTVVLDFAHNEAGLEHLLKFAKTFIEAEGRLTGIIGTAGDRSDEVFRGIARIASENADVVVLKDSRRYLRGRETGDMIKLMRSGIAEGEGSPHVIESPSEREACLSIIPKVQAGDVVAVMCVEDYDFLIDWLEENATPYTG